MARKFVNREEGLRRLEEFYKNCLWEKESWKNNITKKIS